MGQKLGRSRIAWLKNNWVLVALALVALLGFIIMIALLAEKCEANIVTVSNVVAFVLAKNVSAVTISCADETGANVGTVPCIGTTELAEICGPMICQNSTRQSLIAAKATEADGETPIVCRDCIKGVRKGTGGGGAGVCARSAAYGVCSRWNQDLALSVALAAWTFAPSPHYYHPSPTPPTHQHHCHHKEPQHAHV